MRLWCVYLAALVAAVASAGTDDDDTASWVMGAIQEASTVAPASGTTVFNLNPGRPRVETSTPQNNLQPNIVDKTVNCMTRENRPGICVLYYQCNTVTKTVIDDGADILDLRTNVCPHYLEVCCMENEVEAEQTPTFGAGDATPAPLPGSTARPREPDTDVGGAPQRNNQDKTTENSNTNQPSKPVAPVWAAAAAQQPAGKSSTHQCGWSNPGASPLNVRDSDTKVTYAAYGDFPWMVALLKRSNSAVWTQANYLGGGSLIHPAVVLTVAHKMTIRKKVLSPDQLKCRAGEWDIQTEAELYPFQERNVAKYIIHEDYYRPSLHNDIALLIMESPFAISNTPHIGTACLATAPPTGVNCYSMGWGKEFQDKKQYAVIMKKVPLHIVPSDTCQQMLRENSRLGTLFELHESLICAAGKKDVDTCRGDGGSSLVCPISNDPSETRYAVYGLVAYGIVCGNPNIPSLYTNVVLLKNWVDAKMQQEGFDTKLYTA